MKAKSFQHSHLQKAIHPFLNFNQNAARLISYLIQVVLLFDFIRDVGVVEFQVSQWINLCSQVNVWGVHTHVFGAKGGCVEVALMVVRFAACADICVDTQSF